MTDTGGDRPLFDQAMATMMVGKYVILGITYEDHRGSFAEQKQLHGRLVAADGRSGFVVKLEGAHDGETFALPPDMRFFRTAAPGQYKLRSTSEVVNDPDYLATLTITRPPAPA